MAGPLWFTGVCDTLLGKVRFWSANWSKGTPYATRDWMDPRGAVIPIVTMREVKVPWTRAEFEQLIRILSELKPTWTITADLKAAFNGFNRCQLLPGNQRLMAMRCYEKDPQEILAVLLEAKSGKVSISKELDQVVSEQGDGPLWG